MLKSSSQSLKTIWNVACHAWFDQISTHTPGRVLDLSTGIRINDMFKKQQETDQSKTIILLFLGHFHAQMSLKILGNLCPICKDPFIKKLNNLTDSLNKRFCLTMQVKTVDHILKVMTVKMTASQISTLSTRFLQVR